MSLRLACPSRCFRVLSALMLVALVSACALTFQLGSRWTAEHLRYHPLTDRIWDTGAGRFVEPEAVAQALARADFVLLGERHDNPDHHRLQARLLRRLAALGRRPAVAFEMLTSEQAEPLARHLAAQPGDAAGIGEAVGWEKSGWPPWPLYQPIAEAALAAEAPLLAASLPRRQLRAVVKQGAASLGEAKARALGLETELPAAAATRLHDDIVAAHCDQLPSSMIRPMATAQRVKDAEMAATLTRGLAMAGRTTAVLIAGDGHIRRDYGVPWHLGRLAPGTRTLVVAMLEVDEASTRAGDYAAAYGGALPFDFVWFTPAVDLDDPCEKYAEALRRVKAKKRQ
ncbi:MAG: ChaN family lipoprotein [Alphaproteobacteria bacterium]|nr:ChaN family lipoprotein [Alphaproteobacteria bacterium]